jgi:hypothetical protein
MSTMHEFYAHLFQTPETDNSDWASLLKLTRATVAQLSVVKSLVDWVNWHSEAI